MCVCLVVCLSVCVCAMHNSLCVSFLLMKCAINVGVYVTIHCVYVHPIIYSFTHGMGETCVLN